MNVRSRIPEDVGHGLAVAAVSMFLFTGLLVGMGPPPPAYPVYMGFEMQRNAYPVPSESGPRVAYGLWDRPANASAVPVLCHHFLRENTGPLRFARILGGLFLNLPLLDDMDVWTQTAAEFDKQMAFLSENGYQSIDMGDLVSWQHGLKTLPEKCVVITFDDGDRSVLELAYPILKKYGLRATVFVVTSKVGRNWTSVEGMTWEELRFLHESGVFEVESHSHNLHYKVKTSKGHMPIFLALSEGLHAPEGDASWQTHILRDLQESRRLIARHLGHDARHLAWPYGSANAELDSIAAAAGFQSMGNLDEGANRRHTADAVGLVPIPLHWRSTDPVAVNDDSVESSERLAARLNIPFSPAAGVSWEPLETKRFTITARTSIRNFRDMLTD